MADVEWVQVLIRDALYGDVCREDYRRSLTPFAAIVPSSGELKSRVPQAHAIDAKSLFDVIKKGAIGSRQDRRTAVEAAIIAEAMEAASGVIRWIPHWKMPADGLTHADPRKTNGALEHLIRTGMFQLVAEADELKRRAGEVSAKSRSRAESQQQLQLEDQRQSSE